MPLPFTFDWKNPDYRVVYEWRLERLKKLRAQPAILPLLKQYYRDHPAQLIIDFGNTYDPRLVRRGLPANLPFLLFPKQEELAYWIMDRWKAGEPGLIEKSRDMGITWLVMSLACVMCLTNREMAIGTGSRKEMLVDVLGDPDSMLEKARLFMSGLPREFRGGWDRNDKSCSAHMRIRFPETDSIITGEAGDAIGRGGRKAIYLVDEAAHLERPHLIDASLSANTDCRIDLSSVKGMANPFAAKRFAGNIKVFSFHWAQPMDAQIVTPSGSKPMQDMHVGDFVIGLDGTPKRVNGVFKKGIADVYRVTMSDGSSTECCADHLWSVIPYGNQRAERKHIRKVMALSEIMVDYKRVDNRGFNRHLYQVPLTEPVQFDVDGELPLHPYIIGALIGDGSLPIKKGRFVALTVEDKEIADECGKFLPNGCKVSYDGGLVYRFAADDSYRGGALGRGHHNPVNNALRGLRLLGTYSHTKFIPDVYKRASVEDRIALLCGLMDTDGNVAGKSHRGAARYTTVSRKLTDDVVWLVQSLGGTAVIHTSPAAERLMPGGHRSSHCRESYTIICRLPADIIPFRLPRKVAAYESNGRYAARRSIVDISRVGQKEVQCLSVDGSLYLTDEFIVTHNTDDPRKDQAWFDKQARELDPVTVAQEINIDYAASVEGVVIPNEWIRAAVGAADKLGVKLTGSKEAALDVADEGSDKNGFCGAHGIEVQHIEEWSGLGSDIFKTTERAFIMCDTHGYTDLLYDADGLGAGVRGDANVINERRKSQGQAAIRAAAFRGSAAVLDPEKQDVPGRKNEDYYANLKAQCWWRLRLRFQKTYRAVVEGHEFDRDEIISLSPHMPLLQKLITELSQPTWSINGAGKILIDKKPDGVKSPNLADSVMIRFSSATKRGGISFGQEQLQALQNTKLRSRF